MTDPDMAMYLPHIFRSLGGTYNIFENYQKYQIPIDLPPPVCVH